MFIIDCTASMCSWIEVCKKEIKTIIDSISNKFDLKNIRISIIAYRDYCDSNQRFEIFPFSTDIHKCLEFLSGLRALGGGDSPEDMATAFAKAL